jgi:hypothetical protein
MLKMEMEWNGLTSMKMSTKVEDIRLELRFVFEVSLSIGLMLATGAPST